MEDLEDKYIKVKDPVKFPERVEKLYSQAARLMYYTIAALSVNIVVVMALANGSQAMKASWLEDALSLTPAIVFLGTHHFLNRPPNPNFPYGYEKLSSVGFLISAGALLFFGAFLMIQSLKGLLTHGHTTIGAIEIFGFVFWKGWLMMAVLVVGALPTIILGIKKRRLAIELNDAILYTDSKVLQADWLTALAGCLGLLGIALGFWWADSAAALFISVDITWDGIRQVRTSWEEMIDKVPMDLEGKKRDPLLSKIVRRLEEQGFEPTLRFQSRGPRISGQVFLPPRPGLDVKKLREEIMEMDWRIVQVEVVVEAKD